MTMINKQKVITGRISIDSYRQAHSQLYSEGWHKSLPESHTPLLNKLMAELKEQGFNKLDEFFAQSEELNALEINLKDRWY